MLAIPLLWLVLGLALVIKGADILVDGASSLAKRFGVSEIVIGLTIVSLGTSAPEVIVNIIAAMRGESEIVFGNIIGSNLFNILAILSIAGLLQPIPVKRNTIWKEIPFSFLAIVVLFILANEQLFSGAPDNRITRGDGLILLIFFGLFTYYVISLSQKEPPNSPEVQLFTTFRSALYLVLGLGGLFLGGKLVVDNAILIATALHVSNKLIALTIVAGGTSLPELATSVVAASKKRYDIAIGNVVGSNIFNMFWVLGLSAVVRPLEYNTTFNADLLFLAIGTLFLLTAMFTGKKDKLDRWEAAVLLSIFSGYLLFAFIRS